MSVAATFAILALFATACGGGDEKAAFGPPLTSSPVVGADQPPEETAVESSEESAFDPEEPTTTSAPLPSLLDPPYSVEFDWGVFSLAEGITNRMFVEEGLTFVLSVSDRSAADSGALIRGWRQGVEEVSNSKGRDITAQVIGPAGPDAGARAVELAALVEDGEVDCLAVDSANDVSVADAVDDAVSAGIPVFALGSDSPFSRRFAFYGIDDLEAGRLAGSFVGQWATDKRILLLKAGVLAQDPSDSSAGARMKGFIETFLELQPHVEFVNGPEDVEPLGIDPVEVYDSSAVWLQEHPDVDMILQADGGLEELARAIGDQFLHGDVYAVGFGMSNMIGNLVHDGVVVATLLEGLEAQADTAAQACGNFLFDGMYDVAVVTRDPLVVYQENLESSGWASPDNS